MTYTPRYYQEDAVKHTFNYINKGGRAGIAALPTASGKSLVIAEIIKRILVKKNHVRIMMLTHVKELIEQNHEKIRTIWPTCPAGIYSASIGFRQFSYPVVYGGIQSCYRKPQLFGHIDILFIDECHTVSENAETMYGKMIAGLKETNPNIVILGLTATPYRTGLGLLTNGPIFDDIYYDITTMDDFVRLIDEGYLSNLVPFNTDSVMDVSNVKITAGEFNKKSLDENVNRDEITKAIVAETKLKAQGRNKGLTFCVNKSHAENMAMRYNEAGFRAGYIHSDLTKDQRIKVLADFESGKINMLTNVGVLTTGFDSPDIDYLVSARPTESTSLHVQMLGRGMRVHPSKTDTMVLDFAGNCIRLGPINDPVLPVMKGEAKGEAPIRICEECGAICHAAAKFCDNCGHEFPPPKVRFSDKIQTSEIIRRKDQAKIETEPCGNVVVNDYVSLAGNSTTKVTFVCGVSMYDDYFMFDRGNGSAYRSSMQKLGKLKFDEPIPEFENSKLATIWISEHIIKPDGLKIWKNKPIAGKKKKQKAVLAYLYNDLEESNE